MGKTVLLNEIENIARDHGWATISETATPGVAQRLQETYLPLALDNWGKRSPKSHITMEFLRAMTHDKGESKIAEIAGSLGKTVQEISVYRQRLLKAEVIASTGHGKLSFVLPYMQEFITQEFAE